MYIIAYILAMFLKAAYFIQGSSPIRHWTLVECLASQFTSITLIYRVKIPELICTRFLCLFSINLTVTRCCSKFSCLWVFRCIDSICWTIRQLGFINSPQRRPLLPTILPAWYAIVMAENTSTSPLWLWCPQLLSSNLTTEAYWADNALILAKWWTRSSWYI